MLAHVTLPQSLEVLGGELAGPSSQSPGPAPPVGNWGGCVGTLLARVHSLVPSVSFPTEPVPGTAACLGLSSRELRANSRGTEGPQCAPLTPPTKPAAGMDVRWEGGKPGFILGSDGSIEEQTVSLVEPPITPPSLSKMRAALLAT